MELPLSYVFGGNETIATANRPNWRLFRVPHVTADTPQPDMPPFDTNTKLPATWLVSNSTVAAEFSATCYLTADHISQMLWADAPFGLIWASWGGTRVEAWAPHSTKKLCPSASAEPAYPGPQSYSALYNGMIAPLTRFSVRGAFWFQGEHNVVTHSSRESYACIFGATINAWRDAWTGIGDFPFIWAQLAPYTGYAPFPGHGDISIVRLAQADDLPHIGLDTTVLPERVEPAVS
jgi:sialate O-acetylesterase